MKYLSTLLLTLSCITAALAGNDGPSGDIKQPVKVVAKARFSGGLFMPPNVARSSDLQILNTGAVQVTYYYQQRSPQVVTVATLDAAVVAKIIADVKTAVAGEMVDPTPNQRGCEDAPTYSYSAIKPNGQEIELAQKVACKDLQKSNITSLEDEVVRVLKALQTLEVLARPVK